MTSLKLAAVCFLVVSAMTVHATIADNSSNAHSRDVEKVRVGSFDSRAIAVAYVRSDKFKNYLEGLQAELEQAKAANDEKRVKELEIQGPEMQKLIHKQGFSIWPVNDILEHIKGDYPEIAEQADVDVIICKWDIVYKRADAELVDVTNQMVKLFDPDEATLKVIEELLKKPPVPLKDLDE